MNVDALLLCFSLEESYSLEDINFWNELFEEHKAPDNFKTLKYLIAMKSDSLLGTSI